MTSEEFKNQVQYKSIISEKNIFNAKTETLEVQSLFDNETNRLLAISRYNNTILILNESVENSYARHSLNKLYDLNNLDIFSNKPYLIRIYNGVIEQDEDNFSYDELYHFHLIAEKSAILDYFNFRINVHRRSVLNQAKLYKTRLNNTENMRLKYKNLIKDCKDITKLNLIVNQFLRESQMYARI